VHFGDPKESHKFAEESVSLGRKSGDKRILAWVLLWAGVITFNKNYVDEAQEISIDLGNKVLLAFSYGFLAIFTFSTYDYYEGIELYHKFFSLYDEVGSTFLREMSYNNLGLLYRATNQLDKALECLQRALKGSRVQSYLMLSNIGYTYLLQNELEKAQKYYLDALEKSEEVKESRNLPGILYQLVSISIELKEFTQAQKHLKRLEELSKETGFEHISLNAHFASILLLKASGEISTLAEAIKLLKELLTKEDLDPHWRLEALYSLLEIRIKELQISATKEALAEVKKQAIRLEVEAEERKYQWLLGNVYRLQSQLALIEIDAETAFDLLKKAETIAIETKNEFLKEKLTKDHEKINQQLGLLQKLLERKAPISETVKLASLENTMQSIKQETVLEERDEETGKIIEYRKLFALKI
jgi:tetratricopeptide (TPR) repeat protein